MRMDTVRIGSTVTVRKTAYCDNHAPPDFIRVNIYKNIYVYAIYLNFITPLVFKMCGIILSADS